MTPKWMKSALLTMLVLMTGIMVSWAGTLSQVSDQGNLNHHDTTEGTSDDLGRPIEQRGPESPFQGIFNNDFSTYGDGLYQIRVVTQFDSPPNTCVGSYSDMCQTNLESTYNEAFMVYLASCENADSSNCTAPVNSAHQNVYDPPRWTIRFTHYYCERQQTCPCVWSGDHE